MGRPKHADLPSQIGEILARIQAWRSSRKSGAPMPEDLWREAGDWAAKVGINPVCKALGLSYADLKKRLQPKQVLGVLQLPKSVQPTFAALDGAFFTSEMSPVGPVVEVTKPDGGRLVVRLALGSAVDTLGLLQSFLEPRG